MAYRSLSEILQQEGNSFQKLEHRWRPTDLLYLQQTRSLLKDMADRYHHLAATESELAALERAHVYIKLLRRMEIRLRQAGFVWKLDHLLFIQTVASFYSDYGAVLRLLKIEQSRGRFREPPVT